MSIFRGLKGSGDGSAAINDSGLVATMSEIVIGCLEHRRTDKTSSSFCGKLIGIRNLLDYLVKDLIRV